MHIILKAPGICKLKHCLDCGLGRINFIFLTSYVCAYTYSSPEEKEGRGGSKEKQKHKVPTLLLQLHRHFLMCPTILCSKRDVIMTDQWRAQIATLDYWSALPKGIGEGDVVVNEKRGLWVFSKPIWE